MAMKSIVGRVRSTQLEESLSGTIVADYIANIDNDIMSTLSRKGDNIELLSLGYFIHTVAPESFKRLVNLYDRTMGLEEGVQNIPDEVKATQGALFDGLVFGYDTEKDVVELYTMNFDLLMNDLDVTRDMASMCMKSNLMGQYKAFRIDVEYEVGPETFNFKAVNHRKVLDDEKVILLPYIACVRLMKMIESFLSSGAVLKVKQEINGVEKLRYVTRNSKVLAKYCDTPEAVGSLEPSFFPLKAFFYAPVLGAPSTTAMVTNINLFNMVELKKVKIDRLSAIGIEKAEDPVRSIIEDSTFSNTMYSLVLDNPHKAADVVDALPRGTEVFANIENVSRLSTVTFSKYLHGLSNAEKKKALESVPGVSEGIQTRLHALGGGSVRVLTPEEMLDLRGALRNNVCRFIIRKKDCTLSSMIGTNNTKILAAVYGNDYFAKYESFGVRFAEVVEEVQKGRNLQDAMEANGFVIPEGYEEQLRELISMSNEGNFERVRQDAANILGYATRKSSGGGGSAIMFRTLSGYITEDGVMDYYRSIDLDKVVSAVVIA